jgi:hypothetical protein
MKYYPQKDGLSQFIMVSDGLTQFESILDDRLERSRMKKP